VIIRLLLQITFGEMKSRLILFQRDTWSRIFDGYSVGSRCRNAGMQRSGAQHASLMRMYTEPDWEVGENSVQVPEPIMLHNFVATIQTRQIRQKSVVQVDRRGCVWIFFFPLMVFKVK
jgi:hypothetical protein